MRKRLSQAKRASLKLFGKGSSSSTDGDTEAKDNHIVRYRGVSVRFLREMKEDLVKFEMVRDVDLRVLTEDISVKTVAGDTVQLEKGSTIRVKKTLKTGIHKCRVKYVGAFDLNVKDAPLEKKPREEWTIEDVCEFVVLEQTHDENLFYLDLMDAKDVGEPFEGAFLIHARKSCFCDLVEALVTYYDRKGVDPDTQFIWFDVFCANQPLLTEGLGKSLSDQVRQSYEHLLREGLHDAIARFQERLIYFNSWLEPYPLQRAWCVWEVFGCVKCEKPLDILYQPGEEKTFVKTLLSDREQVTKNIMNIRLENAECYLEAGKRDIDRAVEEQVGYHKLNVTISAVVHKWLKIFAEMVVAERRIHDGSSSEFARILTEVGKFFASQLGLTEEALGLLNESFKVTTKLYGRDSLEAMAVLTEIAVVYRTQGEYDKALESFERVLEVEEQLLGGKENGRVARTMHMIARMLQEKSEYEAAMEKYEEVLAIKVKVYGRRDHPEVAATLYEQAYILRERGEFDAAIELYEEVLQVDKKQFGTSDHPVIADRLQCLAQTLERKGDLDAALELLDEAIRIQEKAFGGREHPVVAILLHDYAEVLQMKGECDRPLEILREVFATKEKLFGRNHAETGTTLHSMGGLLLMKGDYQGAYQCFKSVLEIYVSSFGTREHLYVAISLQTIGTSLQFLEDHEAALEVYQEALEISVKVLGGREHPYVVGILIGQATSFNALKRLREAKEKLDEAEATLCVKPVNEFQSWLLREKGVWNYHMENLEESRRFFEENLDLRINKMGENETKPRVQQANFLLARTLIALGHLDEAASILEKLLVLRQSFYPEGHIRRTEVEDLLQTI